MLCLEFPFLTLSLSLRPFQCDGTARPSLRADLSSAYRRDPFYSANRGPSWYRVRMDPDLGLD